MKIRKSSRTNLMTSLPWFENQLKKLWKSKALDEVGTLSNVYTGSRVVYSRLWNTPAVVLGWTLCVVFFVKNGFSEKNHRQKRPPFFPVILSEKTLFPVIFAT
jgi:hypothetical protein